MSKTRTFIAFFILLSIFGCGIYSFGGGKLKDGLKTVSIETFDNNAQIVVPTLAQDLTERLKDKFNSQSNLTLVVYDGDMQFSGSITGYAVAPVAIQGNVVAASNRLTIQVKVKYECGPYPEDNWDKGFSQFADFSSNQNLNDVEAELVKDLVDRLTTDIFNKVLGNW